MPRFGRTMAAILVACTAPVAAKSQPESPSALRFGLGLSRAQPASDGGGVGEPEEPPTASDQAVTTPSLSLFGEPGTDWLTISGGVADDFDESTDFNLSLSWSRFVVRDVEFGAEAGVWYFDQEVDEALGLSGTLFLRWHFVSRRSWSLFTDGGIGLMASTDDVPDAGTSFNFTPRAGFGATFRVAPDETRLEVGLRWSHVSNARITGNEANPGRDGPMLYVGVIFPF